MLGTLSTLIAHLIGYYMWLRAGAKCAGGVVEACAEAGEHGAGAVDFAY